jgi:hypothetical protein
MRLSAADVRFRTVGRREVATLARGWRARLRSWAAGAGPGLAVGLGLGLLALGPGLRRGFLLSYDMVFVPRQPFTAVIAGLTGGPPRAVPSDAVVAAAARVLPADIVQKLVLLSIFVLACSGAAALLAGEPWFARLAAGVFYAWNPFVAERLIIGQWALLLGYAGLPWALRAVTTCPVASWRGAGRLGLALLPAAVGGFAAMTISALVVLPAAVLASPGATPAGPGATPAGPGAAPVNAATTLASPVTPASSGAAMTGHGAGRRVAAGLAALGVLGVLSLPWLIPSLLRPVYADPAGVAAFAARADTPFGAFGSLLMLGGIWNAQTVPAGYGGWWSVLWLALVIAALAGYVAFAARQRCWPGGAQYNPGGTPGPPLARTPRWPKGLVTSSRCLGRWPGLGVAAVAGLAIAVAGATGPGQDLFRDMARLWPGFAVLRDGQQYVAPLALAEALGAGLLVAWVVRPRKAPDRRARAERPGLVIAVALLVAPVLLLPGLAWGAAGRLRPVWYPAAWLRVAAAIDTGHARGDALLLPWAAYRRPAWNGGRAMLDPWPRLVSRQVIWNDGAQIGRTQLRPDDPAARRLTGVITAPGPLTRALANAGVRFVIVDSGGSVAGRLPGCRVFAAGPGLVVYQVPGSR